MIFARIGMQTVLVKIEKEIDVFDKGRIELDGGRVNLDRLVGIFVLGHESLLIEFSFQNLFMLSAREERTRGQIIVRNFIRFSVDYHALICKNVRILVICGDIRLITTKQGISASRKVCHELLFLFGFLIKSGTIRLYVLIIFILVSN